MLEGRDTEACRVRLGIVGLVHELGMEGLVDRLRHFVRGNLCRFPTFSVSAGINRLDHTTSDGGRLARRRPAGEWPGQHPAATQDGRMPFAGPVVIAGAR